MNNNGSQQPAAGKEDYLDKGLDTAEKKFGGAAGANTEKNRGVNEKIVCYPKQEAIWLHRCHRFMLTNCCRPMVHEACSRRLRARMYRTKSRTKLKFMRGGERGFG
jgi:hypothetical protein